MTLVEKLRGYCHDLRDSQWLRVVPAMNEAADRIEALEKALREIIDLAQQRKDAPYSNVLWNIGAAETIALTALKDDDWHYEGDDITEPPLRKGE